MLLKQPSEIMQSTEKKGTTLVLRTAFDVPDEIIAGGQYSLRSHIRICVHKFLSCLQTNNAGRDILSSPLTTIIAVVLESG